MKAINLKAIVTGGCSGLGLSFTKYLASLGYTVYAIYNTSEESAKNIKSENIIPIQCDITDEEKVKEIIQSLDNIDLLINNAGYACDNYYMDKTKGEFMRVLEVNVVGTFLVTKYVINKMNQGTIINISSNNALDNFNPISMDYDASKAGVNMLTRDFSLIKDDVKVISICPGWINTDSIKEMNQDYLMEEMKKVNQERIIEPSELVKKIIDEMNNYKNGSIIEIKEV